MVIALSNAVNENSTISNPLIKEFIVASGMDANDPNSVDEVLQVLSYGCGPVVEIEADLGTKAFGEFKEGSPFNVFVSKKFAEELENETTIGPKGKVVKTQAVNSANKLMMFLILWHEGIHYEDYCYDGVSQPESPNPMDLDVGQP